MIYLLFITGVIIAVMQMIMVIQSARHIRLALRDSNLTYNQLCNANRRLAALIANAGLTLDQVDIIATKALEIKENKECPRQKI